MEVPEHTVLDCSDTTSAIASLAPLFRMSTTALTETLLGGIEVVWDHPTLPPDDQIYQGLGFVRVEDLPVACCTKWFHGTRASHGRDFSAGLLPTRDAYPVLLSDLWEIAQRWVTASEWKDYLASINSPARDRAKDVRRKQLQNYDLGPFAFMVKESLVKQEPCVQKPYHQRGSEILELLCWDFEDVFDKPLLEEYLAATQSCLVIFHEPRCRPYYTKAALTYAYYRVNSLGLSLDCNMNFDGNGTAVPRDWIAEIEWL